MSAGEDVLVVGEHRSGEVRDVSYQLLTAGRELADDVRGDLHVAVIGGEVDTFASALNRAGVDRIHTIDEGDEFNHDIYVQTVAQLDEQVEPTALLLPNSVNGLDYAPAVSSRLDRPLVTDVIGLECGDELTATREMYGSKVETTVAVDLPAVVTVRDGEWPAATADGDAPVVAADVTVDEDAVRSTVKGFEAVGAGEVDIADADALVSIGRGIEEAENLDLVFALADALGATVSSSRPIVDNGWLPKDRQVGQSGKTVTPDVYLAIGISGAVQHVAGMKNAETIVAINTDPNAPIFDIADYGVVDDLFDIVPALIDEFGGDVPDI